MLVDRLYNAGLSRRVLQETFRVDLKTIQRWAAALRSRDAEERWADLSRSGTYD
jgi:hypothetical protein